MPLMWTTCYMPSEKVKHLNTQWGQDSWTGWDWFSLFVCSSIDCVQIAHVALFPPAFPVVSVHAAAGLNLQTCLVEFVSCAWLISSTALGVAWWAMLTKHCMPCVWWCPAILYSRQEDCRGSGANWWVLLLYKLWSKCLLAIVEYPATWFAMGKKERKRVTHFQPVTEELTCIITKCIYWQNWLNIGQTVSTRFRSLRKQLYRCFKCIVQGHLFWFLRWSKSRGH